ncbi:unnamed protein product [Chilo suppressalis]|uniref:Tetratricopeptide repeat protein 8 n=1 Tax=Chilo suppressalis TaxID=168631 RepID=A0ABN8BFH2_CHISP|nr:hypothetical protein evm_014015 [Chilo suppressalis]CAH0406990.1 unnamed protein product [Chilo suppressalis]
MEDEYRILNLYKSKQYDECIKLCSSLLFRRHDRMVEFVQMRAMSIQAKIIGNGYEEVEYSLQNDDLLSTAVAKTPRPGTTFVKTPRTNMQSKSAMKTGASTTKSRGYTNTARAFSARSALHTAARASRAATALAGVPFATNTPLSLRYLTKEDKLFTPAAKTLFEYVYYSEGDIRKAMDIAFQAQKNDQNVDWWWHFSLARCYLVLGMHRHSEDCLRQALKQNKHIAIYLRLVAMYVSLNQPLSALEVCKQGLSVFHEYTPLSLEQARIHDQMGNTTLALKEYRTVASEDPSNTEAIASIATFNFYNDQPEIALRYYRRLLATSNPGPEIYNNLGLCCLYCNQWDLILPCFRQALYFSTSPENRSDIWFNLSHVALMNTTADEAAQVIALLQSGMRQCDVAGN